MGLYENCLNIVKLGVETGVRELGVLLDISEIEIVDRVKGDLQYVLDKLAVSTSEEYFYVEIWNDSLKTRCVLLFEGNRLLRVGCESTDLQDSIIPEVFCSNLHKSEISIYKLILPTFQWKDEMIFGYPPMDSQHMELLNLWNDFLKKLLKDPSIGSQNLGTLITHVVKHLDFEEELMKKYKYPATRQHIKEHENFKSFLNQLLQRSYQIGVLEALKESLGFIYAYLHHLNTFDRALAFYLKRQQSH